MELHQLRYFLAIAQAGSFTAAAKACHVAQPSLSSQIKKLELELGGPLFERARSGARLTQRGELFKGRAGEAIRQLEAGRMEAQELSGLKRGSVTLGCMPTTGAYLLPPILKAMTQAHPEIQVILKEDSSPQLSRMIRESEIDLAIVDEAGLGSGIASETLFTEPLYVAVPQRHPFAKRRTLQLTALRGEPIILMKSGHGFRKIVLDALARAGVEPRVVHESGEIETIQALVESGLGLSLVPAMVRRKGPVFVSIGAPTPSRSILLAWKEDAALSSAARAVRELSLKLLGKLGKKRAK